MKRFSSEFIEQVRQANDIVSVISDYVSLNRRGRNFWACCPFHNEKTASFSVTADKGFFYCFGCHAHGDVFQFIMKKENLCRRRRAIGRTGPYCPARRRTVG